MKILLVYAHPQKESFNSALKENALHELKKKGHEVKVSDLYAMNFEAVASWKDFTSHDPNIPKQYHFAQKYALDHKNMEADILLEQEKLEWCDTLILQFPLWWFSTPAIMKGWMDRVFTKGFSYDENRWFETSPLFGRKAMLALTTAAPQSSFTDSGINGDIETLLKPIHHSLHFVGFATVKPFIAYEIYNADENKKQSYLSKYVDKIFDIPNAAGVLTT
jgi:NAD(P)H dehydrogenase (quinone)